MYLVCYLAHDETYLHAVQERLALASPPIGLVAATTVPELISRAQTLPIRAILVDISWPRATWLQLKTDLAQFQRTLPIFALAQTPTDLSWWQYADDLLVLNENYELFMFRLERGCRQMENPSGYAESGANMPLNLPSAPFTAPSVLTDAPGMLEMPQFRRFAEIFSGLEESALVDAFIAWVQSACQTSRAVLLLRNEQSGHFACCASRGLPSALVPHCVFPQTAPICRWLSTTGRILLRDPAPQKPLNELMTGLDLLQAVAAVPVLFDGQLVGILGLGPRLIGQGYTAVELEGVFAIASQIAVALDHCRMHRVIKQQQELTELVLGVMPTGTIVINHDHCIEFINSAAATMLGKPRAALQGMDLRGLPSPLGDLAYESLVRRTNLPTRDIVLPTNGLPVAFTGFLLDGERPSAMILLEDRSAQKDLEEERGRRVDLEMVTNLVHYLAHELRNPLVTLSTFSNLVPTRVGDADFQEFCDSVLQPEIGRVNLIIEQLLVLTNHAEFQFGEVDFASIVEQLTAVEDVRSQIVTSLDADIPHVTGDAHRLETAILCLLRTVTQFSDLSIPATLRLARDGDMVELHLEAPVTHEFDPVRLLNPWQQLLGETERRVDLGVATAKYIFEQHLGAFQLTLVKNISTFICRLPVRTVVNGREGGTHDTQESTHR